MKDLSASAVLLFLFLASPVSLTAACTNVPNPGSASNLATVTTQAACAVSSGTYVKSGTTIKISGLATVSGSCDLYAIDANHQCSRYATDYNNVDHLVLWKDTATTNWVSSWQTRPGTTTFDTNSANTTGPFSDIPGIGTHSYFHKSYNYLAVYQNCPATAPYNVDSSPPIEVNVLKCEPKWNPDTNNNLQHLSPGIVSVYLDPNSFAAAVSSLDFAISAWNAQLAIGTVTFQRVSSPSGTGGHCIEVVATDLASRGLCGYGDSVKTDSTGAITGAVAPGSVDLAIDLNWGSWTVASLERTFEHELGHRLGLDDYSTGCDSTGDSAIMQPNFYCDALSNPSTAISINDYMPVNKTVYGGQTRNTCGY